MRTSDLELASSSMGARLRISNCQYARFQLQPCTRYHLCPYAGYEAIGVAAGPGILRIKFLDA